MKFVAFCFAVILALTGTAMIDAKPVRPDNTPKKQAKTESAPQLAGTSNWGEVTQTGNTLAINGHPSWYAVGEIRKDGKVQLIWTLTDNSRAGIGVYTIDGEDLTGVWGWGDEVQLNAAGELTGEVREDRTYKIKPEQPASPDGLGLGRVSESPNVLGHAGNSNRNLLVQGERSWLPAILRIAPQSLLAGKEPNVARRGFVLGAEASQLKVNRFVSNVLSSSAKSKSWCALDESSGGCVRGAPPGLVWLAEPNARNVWIRTLPATRNGYLTGKPTGFATSAEKSLSDIDANVAAAFNAPTSRSRSARLSACVFIVANSATPHQSSNAHNAFSAKSRETGNTNSCFSRITAAQFAGAAENQASNSLSLTTLTAAEASTANHFEARAAEVTQCTAG